MNQQSSMTSPQAYHRGQASLLLPCSTLTCGLFMVEHTDENPARNTSAVRQDAIHISTAEGFEKQTQSGERGQARVTTCKARARPAKHQSRRQAGVHCQKP